jgi:hypothetical protein
MGFVESSIELDVVFRVLTQLQISVGGMLPNDIDVVISSVFGAVPCSDVDFGIDSFCLRRI